MANVLEKIDYMGSGMAIETLIDSTVRVTIRHSDSEPIASVAATASISPVDATGAERPLKPAAPGNRFMAQDPLTRANHPQPPIHRWNRWQFWGGGPSKKAKRRRQKRYARFPSCFARYFVASGLGGGRISDFGAGAPIHGDKARGLLDPAQ